MILDFPSERVCSYKSPPRNPSFSFSENPCSGSGSLVTWSPIREASSREMLSRRTRERRRARTRRRHREGRFYRTHREILEKSQTQPRAQTAQAPCSPERIRHPLRETTWPSAGEARGAVLFSSIRVGPIELRHRTWVPAMVPWRATEEGFVTREVLDWYERFARGQPGAIVGEATGIRDYPKRAAPSDRTRSLCARIARAEGVSALRRSTAGSKASSLRIRSTVRLSRSFQLSRRRIRGAPTVGAISG